ncbi:MAG: AraC family transcriptional regulator [Myxacorys californica WJT36-NPBG1]|jgi:AraC family transcriptional regulator|nr:AraC family transcriptional regulator [Myxacorys californica WJT36-NPBG1]
MSELKPLTVEVAQEENILQVLARPPLRSSQPLQWQGIYVQQHHQPAWETPEYRYTQHMILVHHSEQLVQVERVLDGRRQREQLGDGNIVIVPATVAHQVSWNQENTFTLLFLEPNHLAQVAHETVNSDRVELIPQFSSLDPLIDQLGQALRSEMESQGSGSRLFVDSLTTALSIHLLRHYTVRQQPLQTHSGGLPHRKLQQAINYIQAYLAQDLSLEEIASTVEMSRYYFARLFKQSMGISPYQYVLQQRVEQAKALLRSSSLSIAEIAHHVGFADQSQLTVQFRKFTGTTPLDYRKQL